MSLITLLPIEAHEELAELIAPGWVFAAIAAAVFVVLGFVAWSYRDVANRHSDKTSSSDSQGHH